MVWGFKGVPSGLFFFFFFNQKYEDLLVSSKQ